MPICEKNKNEANETDTDKLKQSLQILNDSVLEMPPKKQNIIADWIRTWAQYLKFEKTFKPDRLKYYKRGDIIHIHFGFNVGNEQGGTHYAVVDNNNNKSSGCVVVVPISSLEKGRTPDSLHGSEIYLGKIIPKTDNDTTYSLNSQLMDIIDRKIIALFTKNHLTK